jgi:hypothetical protein
VQVLGTDGNTLYYGQLEMVQYLVEFGADVRQAIKGGMASLIAAAYHGSLDIAMRRVPCSNLMPIY